MGRLISVPLASAGTGRGRRYVERDMDENRARSVVEALRGRGIDAQVEKAGVYQF